MAGRYLRPEIQKNKRGEGRFKNPKQTGVLRPTVRGPTSSSSSGPPFGLSCGRESHLERGLSIPPSRGAPPQPSQLASPSGSVPAPDATPAVPPELSPPQPFGPFFPNPRSQLRAHPAGSRSPIFLQRGCAKPATSSELLRLEPRVRGTAWPGPGVRSVRRERAEWGCSPGGGAPGAAGALTDILIEGIRGKERHLHGVPRCPQGLPVDTTGVRVRRRKEDPSGKNSD